MMNQTKGRDQNQASAFNGSNRQLIGRKQFQPFPFSVMSYFPQPFLFEPWFPLPQFSYKPEFDLAELPNLRRRALNSNLSSLIIYQINYYFSDENLIKDDYLRSHMDNQGWIDVFLIAGFSRIKRMTNDIAMILSSIRLSTTVELQGYKLRKRYG